MQSIYHPFSQKPLMEVSFSTKSFVHPFANIARIFSHKIFILSIKTCLIVQLKDWAYAAQDVSATDKKSVTSSVTHPYHRNTMVFKYINSSMTDVTE